LATHLNISLKVNSRALKKSFIHVSLLMSFLILTLNVRAQTDNGAMSQAEVDRIISRFTTKEAEFRRALTAYSFKRDALIQAIGMGGQVVGEYHRVSTFTFDDQGNRYEKINFFPMSTMGQSVTQEDIEDLGGIKPFALDPSRIAEYNFRYVGKERIDDLNLYVFDVSPKVMPSPKKIKDRMFQGRIWVDDQDLQIVKTKGKGVPETKQNKFPTVETYREHIDGRFWFPTYSYADEELIFDDGGSLHVRIKVKYTDFAVARGTLKVITEVGETEDGPAVPSKGVAKPVEAGVLNARASSLPKAKYPEEARRLRVSGKVTVRVIVDETGKVISALATDGPIPLRPAAVDAAKLATFEPTVQDGVTVKIAGVLVFEFVP
jgi:TonB family protein